MKRLLITGSSGMLASNLNHAIGSRYETYGIYLDVPNPELSRQFKVDLTDPARTKEAVQDIDPEIVVHCAALTNVDECETRPEAARQANVSATQNLVRALEDDVRFIYVSTDSVFDGEKGNYKEDDLVHPLNNYALTKLEGEAVVERGIKNHVIIRTNIFGINRVSGSSFAEWVINGLKSAKPVNMFTDVIFSPVSATTLSLYIERLFDADLRGRINIGNTTPVSKYDFGVLLAKELGFDPGLIRPISIGALNLKARRPKNMSLDLSKAGGVFGKMPTLKEEITRFAQALKERQDEGAYLN